MIEVFISNLLIIWGARFCFMPGQIMGNFSGYIDSRLSQTRLGFLSAPLFYCTPCMSSIYGLIGFLQTDLTWHIYPIWAISLVGASAIIIELRR